MGFSVAVVAMQGLGDWTFGADPDVSYARSGEVAIAYQTFGSGPVDVVVATVAGSGLEFDDRGVHELKGVPGEWRLYAVRA